MKKKNAYEDCYEERIEKALAVLKKKDNKAFSKATKVVMSPEAYDKFTKEVFSKERFVPKGPFKDKEETGKTAYFIKALATTLGVFNIEKDYTQKEDFIIA